MMQTRKELQGLAENLFAEFNEKYFGGTLPSVIIAVHSDLYEIMDDWRNSQLRFTDEEFIRHKSDEEIRKIDDLRNENTLFGVYNSETKTIRLNASRFATAAY